MDEEISDITPEMIQGLRDKTGLSKFAIADLLAKGWRYVENLGEISRWEHPMWSLQNKNTEPEAPTIYEIMSKLIND